jgi:hypothetical protein
VAGSSIQPSNAYLPVLNEANRGCRNATRQLHNEILLDAASLSHNYGVDFACFLVELQNRAKGREPTPVQVAVAAIQLKGFHDRHDLQLRLGKASGGDLV